MVEQAISIEKKNKNLNRYVIMNIWKKLYDLLTSMEEIEH